MRRSASANARQAAAVLALATWGCGDDDRPATRAAPAAPGVAAAPAPANATVYAVQLGSYADSGAAERVARALVDSGWTPTVHAAPVGGAPAWRVYVAAAAADSALPELMAAGVRVAGGEALVVRDTFPAHVAAVRQPGVGAVAVNRGSPGLTARTRWALSPDRSAIIAVEAPTAVGGAPAPGGFVFASEALDCYVHADSVRSVAPSPRWDRVTYARAGERPVELAMPGATAPGGPLERRTVAVSAARRAARGAVWVSGPTLDPSLPVNLTRRGAGADGVRITNDGGWIRMADSTGAARIVGPGVVLAATREGRFVIALAPHPDALRDAPTAQLVVYATGAGRRSPAAPCPVVDAPR